MRSELAFGYRHPRESGGPGATPATPATLDSRFRGNDDMRGSEMLEFRAVDTHYGDLHVLKSVDYRIEQGEIVCLLGGNASGKSTTMKAIMGSVVATNGDI